MCAGTAIRLCARVCLPTQLMAEPEVPVRRTATLMAQERKDTGTPLCRTVPTGHLVWIKAGPTALRVPACGGSDNKARLVRVNRSYHQTHSAAPQACPQKSSSVSLRWTHTHRNKHLYSRSSGHTQILPASHTHTQSTGREMGLIRLTANEM